MSRKSRIVGIALLSLAIAILAGMYLRDVSIPLLDPHGPIGRQERDLIILGTWLSAIVVVPVFFMLGFFAWRYRAGNKKARYDPHFNSSKLYEGIWWGVPLVIIAVLAVVTWNSSHSLDPVRPLVSDTKPLKIQVVALQWKWLFIYPEQDIATINYIQFPQNTPLNFEITSDAPMNSFWIPQLGGQIYAMSGMSTKLHLMADRTGDYQGSSANISGGGFSGMNFLARSTTQADFDRWVDMVKQSRHSLGIDGYKELARPSKDNQPVYYSAASAGLYQDVIAKYINPHHPMAENGSEPKAHEGHH